MAGKADQEHARAIAEQAQTLANQLGRCTSKQWQSGRGDDPNYLTDQYDATVALPIILAALTLTADTARAQGRQEMLEDARRDRPAVHHYCQSAVGVWCHHERTWLDGAAQQDDFKCPDCGTKIVINRSILRARATPGDTP